MRLARRCSARVPSSAAGQHRRRLGVDCGHRLSFLRRGAGPFSARILRGRGRVLAPARFARLIARARRRTHLSRRLLTGFRKLAPLGRAARQRSAAPDAALLWGPSYHNPPDVKPISETNLQISEIIHVSLARDGSWPGPPSQAYRIHTFHLALYPARLPIRPLWAPHLFRHPGPEPGASLGSRGSFSGRSRSPPAAAASEVGDGPRLGGRGDGEWACSMKPPEPDVCMRWPRRRGKWRGGDSGCG